MGLYVFQREALLEYPTLPQGELEKIEQLEQLRWLENGWKIRVAEVEHDAVSVDVPEDVAGWRNCWLLHQTRPNIWLELLIYILHSAPDDK